MNYNYKEAYSSFLQSNTWKIIRLKELKKAKYKCSICGEESEYNQVHHIWYSEWANPDKGSLVVLCDNHHKSVHAHINAIGKAKYRSIPNDQKWKYVLRKMKIKVKRARRIKKRKPITSQFYSDHLAPITKAKAKVLKLRFPLPKKDNIIGMGITEEERSKLIKLNKKQKTP